MKIRITDIPAEGLIINDTISLEALNARMREGRENDIEFLEAPQVNITIHARSGGAQTKGTVKSRYRQPCASCLKELERDIIVEANFALQQEPEGIDDSTDLDRDDIGIIFFKGDHVDLEEAIQENLIVSLCRYWSPPRDQAGSCTICGQGTIESIGESKPVTSNLGQLMKKAGVK